MVFIKFIINSFKFSGISCDSVILRKLIGECAGRVLGVMFKVKLQWVGCWFCLDLV